MNLLSFQNRYPDPKSADFYKLVGYANALEDVAEYIIRTKFDLDKNKRINAERLIESMKETAFEIVGKMDVINGKLSDIMKTDTKSFEGMMQFLEKIKNV